MLSRALPFVRIALKIESQRREDFLQRLKQIWQRPLRGTRSRRLLTREIGLNRPSGTRYALGPSTRLTCWAKFVAVPPGLNVTDGRDELDVRFGFGEGPMIHRTSGQGQRCAGEWMRRRGVRMAVGGGYYGD